MQQTLSIIKPDAVKKGVIGKIVDRFESNGLRIAAMKKVKTKHMRCKSFLCSSQRQTFLQRFG